MKLLVFALGALGLLFVLNIGNSALNTISQLDVIEAQRDTWQRPSDVLQSLNLQPGNTVVDLGCGSGYFSLKLSSTVGKSGHVVAEDVRRESLTFLWARALLRHEWNVHTVHGEWNDSHLPARVNAVLISNTYHELLDPQTILKQVHQAMVPGGRLVILDRLPAPAASAAPESVEHNISPDTVAKELLQANFEIVSRQDHFIGSDPGHEIWWIITAREP